MVKAVRIESSRSGVQSPLALGFFYGSGHTSDLKSALEWLTLPGARRYRASAGTGWPGVVSVYCEGLDRWFCLQLLNRQVRSRTLSEQIRP